MSDKQTTPKTRTVHIIHRSDARGITAFCGHFIPWLTPSGKKGAVTGGEAIKGRDECPECRMLADYRAELILEPITVTDLLIQADEILDRELTA